MLLATFALIVLPGASLGQQRDFMPYELRRMEYRLRELLTALSQNSVAIRFLPERTKVRLARVYLANQPEETQRFFRLPSEVKERLLFRILATNRNVSKIVEENLNLFNQLDLGIDFRATLDRLMSPRP